MILLCLCLAVPAFATGQRRSSSSGRPSRSRSTSAHKTRLVKYSSPPVSTKRTSKTQCLTCPRDSHGKIKRSVSAENTFRASHPCPATGKTSGPCRGFVIDQVKPWHLAAPTIPRIGSGRPRPKQRRRTSGRESEPFASSPSRPRGPANVNRKPRGWKHDSYQVAFEPLVRDFKA